MRYCLAWPVAFPVVVCAADVAHAKPDPEVYLLAAAKLGVDPRHCIALEDSLNGLARRRRPDT